MSRISVICSTIEPRKNHLLLLEVWRELVRRDGPGTPKLVLVGGRGWKFEAVAALLDRSPALRGHVVEASGLTTPSLKRLLDGARALLMPSFAEGYGLPVVEAQIAGVPVIASDIRGLPGDLRDKSDADQPARRRALARGYPRLGTCRAGSRHDRYLAAPSWNVGNLFRPDRCFRERALKRYGSRHFRCDRVSR